MEVIELSERSHQKMDESEIVKRILAGEKELYEILVRRNNQKLFRVTRTYLKVEAEIEDVMQNAYIKAFTKLYQFKLRSSFSTWLIRIAINEALARLREKNKVYHFRTEVSESENPKFFEIPDNGQLNPQEKMIGNESKRFLENAIDQLDVKYKSVYMMIEVEELSAREVAEALGIKVANVKIRLHRAKQMLKDNLYELSNDKNIFEFGFGKCDRVTEFVMKNI